MFCFLVSAFCLLLGLRMGFKTGKELYSHDVLDDEDEDEDDGWGGWN